MNVTGPYWLVNISCGNGLVPSDPKPYGDKPLVTKISLKKVQLERLHSENTPALSPMNKPINFIQVIPFSMWIR